MKYKKRDIERVTWLIFTFIIIGFFIAVGVYLGEKFLIKGFPKNLTYITLDCWNETTDFLIFPDNPRDYGYEQYDCKECGEGFYCCKELEEVCHEALESSCKEELVFISEGCGYEWTDELKVCLERNGYYDITDKRYKSNLIRFKCIEDFGIPTYCYYTETKQSCTECRNSLTKERIPCD